MAGFIASQLESPSGARLQLNRCGVSGDKPKAAIQINHGMAEHAARYARFAKFLSKRGYAVFAHDHRGHGATTAPDAPPGAFAANDGWQKVLTDVGAVNRHIKQTLPGVPIICFGHSMGATIAAGYALHHPGTIDALAVWNGSQTGFLPGLLAGLLKIERMLKGSDVPSQLANSLTFEAWNKTFKPNRTGFDWLSRDAAEVDKYIDDPLCGFSCTIGLWLDLMGGLQGLADKNRISKLAKNLPVHLLAGAADPCSDKGKSVMQLGRRLEAAGLNDVTRVILPDTRHESLNEINRDETMNKFADWLDERF